MEKCSELLQYLVTALNYRPPDPTNRHAVIDPDFTENACLAFLQDDKGGKGGKVGEVDKKAERVIHHTRPPSLPCSPRRLNHRLARAHPKGGGLPGCIRRHACMQSVPLGFSLSSIINLMRSLHCYVERCIDRQEGRNIAGAPCKS